MNDFCVVTLSSLYLDIIKDHLYCDGKDSAVRKSAQSALWMILDAMTKVFAPILAFTCDEIWLQMPHRAEDDARNVLFNQMSKPYAEYALSEDEMAKWETAFKVRSDVNGVLETARADKRIGKSLEAHVALTAVDAAAAEAVKAISGMNLAELFIVSNVAVTEEKAPRARSWARERTSPASPSPSPRPPARNARAAGCTPRRPTSTTSARAAQPSAKRWTIVFD